MHVNFKSEDPDVIDYLQDKKNKSKAIREAIKEKRLKDMITIEHPPQIEVKIHKN